MEDSNPVLLPSKATLKLNDGTLIKPTGHGDIPASSADTCERLSLIHVNHSHVLHHVNTPSTTSTVVIMTTEEIISKYKDMLDGLGCLPGELHLEVNNAARPVWQLPRRIPIPLKERITQAIHSVDNADIITKVKRGQHRGLAMWLSCMDPSALNEALLRSHFQMPTIEEILPEISNAKVFSVLTQWQRWILASRS
jgi:hypothetical protein